MDGKARRELRRIHKHNFSELAPEQTIQWVVTLKERLGRIENRIIVQYREERLEPV